MRGDDFHQDFIFSYLSPEARMPKHHPLRLLRQMVNQALRELSRDFQAMYSSEGRPSIPPEKLLQALLLQVLYTIRSERLLMEQLDYNLLFRWFVGLSMDDKVWDHSVFSKNRERFLRSDLAAAFFGRITEQALHAILFLSVILRSKLLNILFRFVLYLKKSCVFLAKKKPFLSLHKDSLS